MKNRLKEFGLNPIEYVNNEKIERLSNYEKEFKEIRIFNTPSKNINNNVTNYEIISIRRQNNDLQNEVSHLDKINIKKLLKYEQDQVSNLIDEIVRYRCMNSDLNAKNVLLDLYERKIISGSVIKKYLNINQYELMQLLKENNIEYIAANDISEEDKEDNRGFLRGLINE